MKTFIIVGVLLGVGEPEIGHIPGWVQSLLPEVPVTYTSLAACKRQARRITEAIGGTFRPRRFKATCEQRIWQLLTPTGVGPNQTVRGTYEVAAQCDAAAAKLKQRGGNIDINAWCSTYSHKALPD
jgi:hypothetical protein